MKVALKAIGTTISRAAAAVSSIGGVCHPCVVHVAQTSRKPPAATLIRVHVFPTRRRARSERRSLLLAGVLLGHTGQFPFGRARAKDGAGEQGCAAHRPRSSSVNNPQSAG